MRVICAWCFKEGKPGIIGERGTRADMRETHGICPHHLERLTKSHSSSPEKEAVCS